jgi:acyl-CoA synthetase (AMP-forming)/AMP-acid ligase II
VRDWYDQARVTRFRDDRTWRDLMLDEYLARRAHAAPDQLLATDEEVRFTNAQAHRHASGLAGYLHEIGVRRGDRVVAQLPDVPEFLILVAALSRLGAVLVPRAMQYDHEDVGEVARRTGATCFVTSASHRGKDRTPLIAAVAAAAAGTLRAVLLFDRAPTDVGAVGVTVAPESFLAACGWPPYEGPRADPDDLHAILFTSGSTAAPKGCMHSANTLYAGAIALTDILGIGARDVLFQPQPLMHMAGFIHGVVLPLVSGATVVLQETWSAELALARIARTGATYVKANPTMMFDVLATYDPQRHDMSSVRFWATGGSMLPEERIRRVQQELGCVVITAFGQSEGTLPTATRPTDDAAQVAVTSGSATPGMDVVVADGTGNELPRGSEGEIRFRGPQVMLGYWDDDELSDRTIDRDGWCHSGDLATMTDEGRVRITGRLSDIVIRGGINISATEVENYVRATGLVLEVAVVGAPDARLGERLCAIVELAKGTELPLQQLTSSLQEAGVPARKWPEFLFVVAALPRTPTGKIAKPLLRERVREMTGNSVAALPSS